MRAQGAIGKRHAAPFRDKWIDVQAQGQTKQDTSSGTGSSSSSFKAPSRQSLDAIVPGCAVKICNKNERFWTRVTQVNGNVIDAHVSSILTGVAYNVGDVVRFANRHVYDVILKDAESKQVEALSKMPAIKALDAELKHTGRRVELADFARLEAATIRRVSKDSNPSVEDHADAILARHCSTCGKTGSRLQCSVCFVRYCSSTCQLGDWPSHKVACRNPLVPAAIHRQRKKKAKAKTKAAAQKKRESVPRVALLEPNALLDVNVAAGSTP